MAKSKNGVKTSNGTPRIIAVVNQKGGSGKTTTVVNLAAALAENKRKVLVIDLDPQHNTTDWLNIDNVEKGIYSIFVENGNVSDIIYESDIANVDVVPSSDWLMGIEPQLAGQPGADAILKSKLQVIPTDLWDYIIIDCQPTLGILTVNALSAASEVIVPVEAHVLALSGFVQLLKTVETIKERLNPELKVSGILPCRVDKRTNHAIEVMDQLRERFNGLVYKSFIRENIRLAECPSFQQPITHFAPKSIGSVDYRSLAKEIVKQEA